MARMFATLVLSALLSGPVMAQEPVYFADPHLKAAVEAELWIADPTGTDMLGLAFLNASSSSITDLTGLECAANLHTLKLTHNQISAISPLSALGNLETLALNTNQISNLSALSGLSNLRDLNLHDNQISDIAPLSGLTGLETLILRINQISDLSALSGLSHLETLVLESNQISDISPLSGLSNLRHLRLGFNEISDISPLSGLNALGYLDLHGNQISDISPVAGLVNLDTLNLEYNHISDISALLGLTSLGRLDLRSNPLSRETSDVYIGQIEANNPGIMIQYDCVPLCFSLSSTPGGSVTQPGEGEFQFMFGDSEFIVLEAQADPGFVFVGWSGSYTGVQNPVYVPLNQDYRIQARFLSTLDVIHVDDDAPDDLRAGDSTMSDPQENGTSEHPFDKIQEAIDVAAEGVTVRVRPGIYRENLDLLGKNIQLIGVDPSDPNGAPYPVVDGADTGPVVSFTGGEDPDCMMIGFVIARGTGRLAGAIYCEAASPTIANCLIVGNRCTGPEGAAIYCTDSSAIFTNCTIADNRAGQQGAALAMVDSGVILANSIVWGNYPTDVLASGSVEPSITYTDIVGQRAGPGNIDADPMFARAGHWANRNDPNLVAGPDDATAVWIGGDYHLRSQAGRWDPTIRTWVQDDASSPCIDGGDPVGPVGREPSPNGGIVNAGAYGGTAQASKSAVSLSR
jgi:hypothetical protein